MLRMEALLCSAETRPSKIIIPCTEDHHERICSPFDRIRPQLGSQMLSISCARRHAHIDRNNGLP